MIDLANARAFIDTHARLLDRRQLDLLLTDPAATDERAYARDTLLVALTAHRNPDGGFGWALEPDLRAPSSQPVGALHAIELLEQVDPSPAVSALAVSLCAWLDAVALDGGALPFSLAGADAPGSAPWWAGADPREPSLHITSAVCGAAHRLAAHDPAVASQPWLARATAWCLDRVAASERPAGAYELKYVLQLLDAAQAGNPAAAAQLERLGRLVPDSGELPVEGGVEGETLRPLDLSPLPGRPLRALIDAAAIERHLDALASEQREDGGWRVDFPSSSPAAELEWRGIATVRAIALLRAHGRI